MRRLGASRRNAASVAALPVRTSTSAPPSRPTAVTSRRDAGSASDLGARASTPREPHRCRRRYSDLVAFNQKATPSPTVQERRERQVVQLGVRNQNQPRLAREQARLFERSDEVLAQLA